MNMRVRLGCGLLALMTLAAAPDSTTPEGLLRALPNKDLSPPEVIRLQLAALAHNKVLGNDRGIEITWRFASPANKAMTGPLPQFQSMVKSGYGAMLDHQRSKLGEMEISALQAQQLVLLQAADGSFHAYLWVLGLQEEGPLRGCWLTDAVIEVDPRADVPKAPASAPSTI